MIYFNRFFFHFPPEGIFFFKLHLKNGDVKLHGRDIKKAKVKLSPKERYRPTGLNTTKKYVVKKRFLFLFYV